MFQELNNPVMPTEEAVKVSETVQPEPIKRVRKVDSLGRSYGTGRRKTSVARVWFIKSDSGKNSFTVNGKDVDQYFTRDVYSSDIRLPLSISLLEGEGYAIKSTVKGGGLTGQSGALRLGISRALVNFDPSLRDALKQKGLMTRDSRKVERKKYGHLKARKSTQYRRR